MSMRSEPAALIIRVCPTMSAVYEALGMHVLDDNSYCPILS
jgi:hypothetical protein